MKVVFGDPHGVYTKTLNPDLPIFSIAPNIDHKCFDKAITCKAAPSMVSFNDIEELHINGEPEFINRVLSQFKGKYRKLFINGSISK